LRTIERGQQIHSSSLEILKKARLIRERDGALSLTDEGKLICALLATLPAAGS
jgi:hypothetical protein